MSVSICTLTNEASTQSTPHEKQKKREKYQLQRCTHIHTHTHAHIFWGVWYSIIWLPCTTTWQHAVHLILCLVSTLTKYFHLIKAIEGWIGWESKCALKKWAQHYHGTACNVALFEKKTSKLYRIHCINESMAIFCVSKHVCENVNK